MQIVLTKKTELELESKKQLAQITRQWIPEPLIQEFKVILTRRDLRGNLQARPYMVIQLFFIMKFENFLVACMFE